MHAESVQRKRGVYYTYTPTEQQQQVVDSYFYYEYYVQRFL